MSRLVKKYMILSAKLLSILILFALFVSHRIGINLSLRKVKKELRNYDFLNLSVLRTNNEVAIETYFKLDKAVIHPHCKCFKEHLIIEKKTQLVDASQSFLSVDLIQPDEPDERHHLFKLTLDELKELNVTCDLYNVLKRGKRQKVISYSIYGSKARYFDYIEENMSRISHFYPNYSARFYYDNTLNSSMRCHFECKYPNLVDFCDINRFSSDFEQLNDKRKNFVDLSYMHKMMWRFLPIGDTFVDLFLSRDTDSFVIQREVDSVTEWLNSSNIGHIMRGKLCLLF